MNQLQLLSIKTLNSPYKFILNILIYLIIYVCITGKVFYTTECMQENTIPSVAEAKPSIVSKTPVNTKSIMQREINNFLDQASVIEEQKRIISERETQLAIQEKRYIELKKGHEQNINLLSKKYAELDVAQKKLQERTNFTNGELASTRVMLRNRDQIIDQLNDQLQNKAQKGKFFQGVARTEIKNETVYTSTAHEQNMKLLKTKIVKLNETKKQLEEKNAQITNIESARNIERQTYQKAGITLFCIGAAVGIAGGLLGSYLETNSESIVKSIKELLQIKR